MEFVWVPEGCFQMGSEQGAKDEKPVHRVCVKGFGLGKCEVTQGQWQRVMGSNPAGFKKGDDHPVEQVSWEDARAVIGKLNGKGRGGLGLPSEAAWEYACRSGGRNQADGLGLHDMSGNVRERLRDCWHENYEAALRTWTQTGDSGQADGSAWAEESCRLRVFRGGSWLHTPMWLRSSHRDGGTFDYRDDLLGFRLAQEL